MEEKYGFHSPQHLKTYREGKDGTCMRAANHDGEHRFTPNSKIIVEFKS